MAYPYDLYEQLFINETGAKPNSDEKKYLRQFSDTSELSSSKRIYCYALFYFKRLVPLFLIRFLVRKMIKETFEKDNAPDSIKMLYMQMAETILLSAMKNYGKGYTLL